MEYEGERKGSAPMSTPPPYLFQQPPPHYFTDQQRVLLQCAYQLPSETQVSHSQQTRIASEWRISPLQAEGCSDVIINAAHPTPNHATDYYLLTIVLLVTCGLMGNLVTFFCLVPALFSASMVSCMRIRLHSRMHMYTMSTMQE